MGVGSCDFIGCLFTLAQRYGAKLYVRLHNDNLAVFLCTQSHARSSERASSSLARSLERQESAPPGKTLADRVRRECCSERADRSPREHAAAASQSDGRMNGRTEFDSSRASERARRLARACWLQPERQRRAHVLSWSKCKIPLCSAQALHVCAPQSG